MKLTEDEVQRFQAVAAIVIFREIVKDPGAQAMMFMSEDSKKNVTRFIDIAAKMARALIAEATRTEDAAR